MHKFCIEINFHFHKYIELAFEENKIIAKII